MMKEWMWEWEPTFKSTDIGKISSLLIYLLDKDKCKW